MRSCAVCGAVLPVQTGRGRPRTYCSVRCRRVAFSQARRERRRRWWQEQYPGLAETMGGVGETVSGVGSTDDLAALVSDGDDGERAVSDLADRLSREARVLFGHVPPEEQPDDDDEGLLRLDGGHVLMVYLGEGCEERWQLVGFDHPEGLAAMRTRRSGETLSATAWRDGVKLGEAEMPVVYPDRN